MNYEVMPPSRVAIQRIKRPAINPVYRFPAVSIFLPFNPKMEMKSKLTFSLSKATDKAISELRDKYPGEMAMLVIQKLKAIIRNLNFSTHKKSLAIFVSPVFEKVYYLNIDLEEKVIVNESLRIRDLVYNKKQSLPFHILLLKEKESRIFLSASNSYIRIMPEKTVVENGGYFPGTSSKEILVKQFLHSADQSLDIVLKNNRLPVIVMGTEDLTRQFKNISHHGEAIIEYLAGDYEESSFEYLKSILHCSITDWQKINQKYLLSQLQDAVKNNVLIMGTQNIWRAILNGREQTLFIERRYVSDSTSEEDALYYEVPRSYNKFSCIKNLIDELIEKALENGGTVELVSNGFLKEYGPIALIKKINN